MTTTQITNESFGWGVSPAEPTLKHDEIHVWLTDLDDGPRRRADANAVLSPNEIQRADRFFSPVDRDRFVAGRLALRMLLGSYLGVLPEEIDFDVGPHGKPRLVAGINTNDLRFNLSHSGRWMVVAFAHRREIGIDLEQCRPDIDHLEIAEQFFSPREIELLRATPTDDQPGAFFRIWTRKEACIKAWGEGLSLPLNSFDVSPNPGAGLISLPPILVGDASQSWSLRDVAPIANHAAALIAQGPLCMIRCWHVET